MVVVIDVINLDLKEKPACGMKLKNKVTVTIFVTIIPMFNFKEFISCKQRPSAQNTKLTKIIDTGKCMTVVLNSFVLDRFISRISSL